MEVVAAIEIPNSPLDGVDAGVQAGIGEIGVKIVGSEKLEETLKESSADVLVDFTIAHAAVETVKKATSCGVNVVVGTTGFTEEQMSENINNVKNNDVKAVISSNMSIGVNVFFNTLIYVCLILLEGAKEISYFLMYMEF